MDHEHDRSHPEEDTTRHIHRGIRRPEEKTVEVDSSAFFEPDAPAPASPPPRPPRPVGGPDPATPGPPGTPKPKLHRAKSRPRNEVWFC